MMVDVEDDADEEAVLEPDAPLVVEVEKVKLLVELVDTTVALEAAAEVMVEETFFADTIVEEAVVLANAMVVLIFATVELAADEDTVEVACCWSTSETEALPARPRLVLVLATIDAALEVEATTVELTTELADEEVTLNGNEYWKVVGSESRDSLKP